jgi:hypothetical protein
MNNQKNNGNAIVTDEDKAFDFMIMHYNRVVTMDEVSAKSLNRAGKTGKAVRDLLSAIALYSQTRNIVKVGTK